MYTEKMREFDRRRYEETKPAYQALMKCYPFELEDLEGEEWRPINGFKDYEVSNYGRVKSFKGKTPRILRPAFRVQYLYVGFFVGGRAKSYAVHALVASAFLPNPEGKPQVGHLDGCKLNNFVGNLKWMTSKENVRHAFASGTAKSGVAHRSAKIKSEADIIYIRENPDNLTRGQLAEKFGVCISTIKYIRRRKSYKNVGDKD